MAEDERDDGWGYGAGDENIESEETLSPDERDDTEDDED
jgi:hypothetical protein